MSQTETLLLFVLGSLATFFVVMLFGRGLWSLLGTWSGWRDARKVPAAIRELQAERDGLKAEKAMMAQKLEGSVTDMKMRMAEQMAEVSRNRNRVLDMSGTLKEREGTIVHMQSQLDDRVAQAASLHAQIEDNVKSINLAYSKMAMREEELATLQGILKESQRTVALRDEKIRNLLDEVKALREIAANYAGQVEHVSAVAEIAQDTRRRVGGSPLSASAMPAGIAVPSGLDGLAANFNSGNPLVDTPEPVVMQTPDTDTVDRSVSNVLSLAERVRSLKSGIKKP
jgi:uncharacterized coiled-coil protein SlyX